MSGCSRSSSSCQETVSFRRTSTCWTCADTSSRQLRRLPQLRAAVGQCQPRHLPLRILCEHTSQAWYAPIKSVSLSPAMSYFSRPQSSRRCRKSVTLDDGRAIRSTSCAISATTHLTLSGILTSLSIRHRIRSRATSADSDMEKYIRRKYEQGAFKAVNGGAASRPAPTSLNRARERDGRLPVGSTSNSSSFAGNSTAAGRYKERDLPAIPRETSPVKPQSRQLCKPVRSPRLPRRPCQLQQRLARRLCSLTCLGQVPAHCLCSLAAMRREAWQTAQNNQAMYGTVANGSTSMGWSSSSSGMTGSSFGMSPSYSHGGVLAQPASKPLAPQMYAQSSFGGTFNDQSQHSLFMQQQQHLQAQFAAGSPSQYQSFQPASFQNQLHVRCRRPISVRRLGANRRSRWACSTV